MAYIANYSICALDETLWIYYYYLEDEYLKHLISFDAIDVAFILATAACFGK